MTVVTTVPHENVLDKEIILTIFSSIGRCRFLDEKHFDACTALSGSGPAFVCLVLEAMADGGVMMGLPRAEALELAAQSESGHRRPPLCETDRRLPLALQGTARMALQSGVHPAQIKDSVTSEWLRTSFRVGASLRLAVRSSRRMHNRRPVDSRRRSRPLDNGTRYSSRNSTRCCTRST